MTDDGQLQVTDGLNANLTESAGGFYIIDVESEHEAIEWAKKGRFMAGSNEVRQLAEFEI